MKRKLSQIAFALATALASASASAAFGDFTVDESSVPGAGANTFVADKLNGAFTEYVTFTSATTFSASAYATMNQFLSGEGGTSVPSQSGCFGANCYNLYAVFQATGTVVGGLNFTGGTGEFKLYIDPGQNTTFALTSGLAPVTLGGTTSDDYLIASASTLESGTGTLASAPGAYNFFFTGFTLTTTDQNAAAGVQAGNLFFTSPNPFYFRVQVNGDNDAATPVVPGTIRVTGDVSAVFVPEPGTLALTGLALGILGFASRRRRA